MAYVAFQREDFSARNKSSNSHGLLTMGGNCHRTTPMKQSNCNYVSVDFKVFSYIYIRVKVKMFL